MKKLFAILFAIALLAPALSFAQVEAAAGSMKFGAHVDVSYLVSNEDNKEPEADEIGWVGYDSVNLQDVIIDLNGSVGDRVSYRILQALIVDSWTDNEPDILAGAAIVDIHREPMGGLDLPLEAWITVKLIDQLSFKFGKQITPTLIANTGAHLADVIHTVNSPLIAQNSYGINAIINYEIGGIATFVRLPLSVTGASAIVSFSGVEIVYTQFDSWLLDENGNPGNTDIMEGDLGYDLNKTKGGNVMVGYNGQVGSGKLNARGFYFDERTQLWAGNGAAEPNFARNSGWGLGAMYNADKFFVGGEYATATLKYEADDFFVADVSDNTMSGYYAVLGGRFSSLEVVYRLDGMDYNNWKNGDFEGAVTVKPASVDSEMWHTIGVNYLINDQTTLLVNYVIKSPERAKAYAGEKVKLPNMNEFSLLLEVDAL